MSELRMRAGRVDVTPSRSGELAGYAARAGALSTGTHDPLEAALVVLDDGSARTGWLSIDAIGVSVELADRLRAAVRDGLADAGLRLVVAASHTHSAPLGWSGSVHPGQPGEVVPELVAELVERVRTLASRLGAEPGLPVTAHWGSAAARGLAANRLRPDGPSDESIGVLALRDAGGVARAIVLDATAHPTVLGPGNLAWSADWPGVTRAVVRAALAPGGGEPVVVFLQGAAGDVSTRFTRRGDGFDEVDRLGSLAAEAALAAVEQGGPPLAGPVRHAASVLEVVRRALPTAEEAERELASARAAREELRALPPLDPRVRIAQTRLDGAVVQRDLVAAVPAEVVAMPISVTAIAEVAWVHVPVELFARIAARIRSRSPFPVTRVVGYADGYRGYLVDEEARASRSYEALSTLFPDDAGDRLVSAVHDLMEGIR